MFDDVFADVGDEQSIEASLSTFSAHLKNLSEILRLATSQSLVLIDELGSGTDPVEGAALGWAILEELTRRGAFTVATTHLGTLKELAGQVEGVVNASLQFDGVALAPTYRLIKGVPGRSYGIAIARRLSLDESVIRRAEERLPQQERDIAALIERLEAKETELATRETEAEAILADARDRIANVSRREHNVRERERAAEKESRKDARRYLLDARAEIEATIKDLKRQGAEKADDAGREARKRVEELAGKQGRELERIEREELNLQRSTRRAPGAADSIPPEEGDSVAVAAMDGRVGRLLEKRGRDALVALGEVKMTFPLKSLTRVQPDQGKTPVAWRGDMPEVEAKTEVDVRGHRVDEAEAALLQAIDQAIRADLRSLRIIHGKGTGALRELVNEMLRKDTRVKGFRLGAWNEGGTGVTVVDLG
jgi:DNA mismatch repair protein MutS2